MPSFSHRASEAPQRASRPSARKERAWEAAHRRLAADILDGRHPPGAALPPQAELAAAFGVSRLTLREAVKALEAEGLVEAVQGDAVRVRDFRTHGGLELLTRMISLRQVGDAMPVALMRDLLELRRLLTVEVAALARTRITATARRRLAGLLTEQEVAAKAGDLAAFLSADLEFSRAVIDSAGNFALRLLFNTLVRAIEQNPDIAFEMVARPADNLRSTRAVVSLLCDGADASTVEVVRRHLERLDARILARLKARNAAHP